MFSVWQVKAVIERFHEPRLRVFEVSIYGDRRAIVEVDIC